MDKVKKGSLNNANTKFGAFRWGDHPKLAKALADARRKLGAELPNRFKLKL